MNPSTINRLIKFFEKKKHLAGKLLTEIDIKVSNVKCVVGATPTLQKVMNTNWVRSVFMLRLKISSLIWQQSSSVIVTTAVADHFSANEAGFNFACRCIKKKQKVKKKKKVGKYDLIFLYVTLKAVSFTIKIWQWLTDST